jgi:hypothetical protein
LIKIISSRTLSDKNYLSLDVNYLDDEINLRTIKHVSIALLSF